MATKTASVPNSVDIDLLVDFRTARPVVSQSRLANALGISGGSLSEFESGTRALPRDLTPQDYLDRLVELKRDAGATTEQIDRGLRALQEAA